MWILVGAGLERLICIRSTANNNFWAVYYCDNNRASEAKYWAMVTTLRRKWYGLKRKFDVLYADGVEPGMGSGADEVVSGEAGMGCGGVDVASKQASGLGLVNADGGG